MDAVWFDDIEIGSARSAGPYHVVEAEMVAFARKWDPLPFHVDAAAARRSVYGGLTASGEYTMAVKQLLLHRFNLGAAMIGSLGYDELRYLLPVRADDRLTLAMECIDKRLSRSKPDRGIVKFRVTLTNQHDAAVLRYIDTVMMARRPG
jgi:acyl dehydratase